MLHDLPPEIWRMVFSYLTTQMSPSNISELGIEALWKNCTFPDPHRARDFPTTAQFMDCVVPCRLWKPKFKSSAEALSVVQVCHAWHDLGLEFLYHTVTVSTSSHLNILKVVLAPSYGRGRFVRRVIIGRHVPMSLDNLQLILSGCTNIEDFEFHEISHSGRLFSPLASCPSIRYCFYTSYLLGIPPAIMSPFTHLQALHIVAVTVASTTSTEVMPVVLPQLAVLVLKCDKNLSHYYQRIAKWTLPSLRVLVCQWIITPALHALCEAFAQTVELLEIIQYDSWYITPDTIEMPMLKYLVVDWIPPFPGYTPRFNASRHFHSLPSLTTLRLENMDRALRSTSAAAVAAEVEHEIAILSPENRFAPRLQTLYVGAELGDIVGGDLERCFATRAAFRWALRGRDGIWKVAGDGKLTVNA